MTLISDPGEPKTMKEALIGPDRDKWIEAVKKEITNFMSRGVWKPVSRKKVTDVMKRKLISTKWIFKKKTEQDNTIRHKARVVSRGFMQIPGVDYTESFAPVASDTAIRTIIAMFLYYHHTDKKGKWDLEMFDVEAAFLNADLDKQVFIEWPQGMQELGFITEEDKKTKCIELTKAMYGNIDSPLRWMKTFSKHLMEQLKMIQSKTDPCIFYKEKNGKVVLIMALYVDDTLCLGIKEELEWMYKEIQRKFKIEKLGRLKKHLGIWYEWKTEKGTGELYLEASMPKLIEEIIDNFKKAKGKDAKLYTTPGSPGKCLKKNTGDTIKLDEYRSLVGKIMYYTTKLAPELSNTARELASHLSNPGEEHWAELERCVGYLRQKKNLNLIYRKPRVLGSISLCDSNYASDPNDRKSISGRLNTVGGTLSNWTSKKQGAVTLSSTEAEYYALSECAQEAVFTQNLLEEIAKVKIPAIIYEDNLGAIFLTKNQQVSQRTKHIDIRQHFLRNLVEEKRLDIRFVRSEDNSSDITTKNTPQDLHEKHTTKLKQGRLDCWKEDVKTDKAQEKNLIKSELS